MDRCYPPELDASLQVLFELQCRNPHADATNLAAALKEATSRYRTNTPAHIRTNRAFGTMSVIGL